ncbi:MAG: MoaD family protein [Nitrospirota bacterium]
MVTIKLFAVLKKMAGKEEVKIEINESTSLKELINKIDGEIPQVVDLIRNKKVLVSVNQEIAGEETIINDGDEIGVLPPFAGGEEMSDMMVRVQEEDFLINTEVQRVMAVSKRIGGVVTFLGTVRDLSKGRDIKNVTFEYYAGMAEKKLKDIRERALNDFDIIEALIVHRVGVIDVGENIVLIVVGAEHRAEAFKACKWCIDELKQITPIWKKEATPEGDVWVEEHP